MKDHNPKYALIVLAVLYGVGILGMLSPYRTLFVSLTPFNLLISLGLLLYFQVPKYHTFYARFYWVVILGFLVELIGVNTGFPFGVYEYGPAFGPQILGTPPLIGVNWFILVYGALVWVKKWNLSRWLTSVLVGVLITLLDMVMEPVAVELYFWAWESSEIPIQNYISWAVIGSILAYIMQSTELPQDLKVAKFVFVLQVLFFGILYFALPL